MYDGYLRRGGNGGGKQQWIAVAGGPGSGKSTLTQKVCDLINAKAGSEIACVIPMDGYHLFRSELQALGDDPNTEYTYDELLIRRGSPWTFDAKRFREDLSKARVDQKFSFPVYCREKSDPIPDGCKFDVDHKIVFIEGNYVLNYNDPEWSPLAGLFDEKWYIACESIDVQRNRLIKRHLETWNDEKTRQFGEGEEGAGKKADVNDLKNVIIIEEGSRAYADKVIVSR